VLTQLVFSVMIALTVVIILYFRFCRIRKLRATKGSHSGHVAPGGGQSHSNEPSSSAGGATMVTSPDGSLHVTSRSSRKVAT